MTERVDAAGLSHGALWGGFDAKMRLISWATAEWESRDMNSSVWRNHAGRASWDGGVGRETERRACQD